MARGLRQTMTHPTVGTMPVTASPLRFSDTPVQYDRPPPLLGQHTQEILREVLGLTDEQIAALPLCTTIATP
jgi:crotonobetainyl-CoA:carnitine CoA-transferase CaiB-like acyl-CoA transferase